MITRSTLIGFAVALAALGCTTGQQSGQPVTVTRAEQRSCPLGVEGATVEAEDSDDGIVLVFKSADKVAELRARAFDASAMFGPGAKMGAGHGGKHGSGGEHGLQAMQLPPSSAGMAEIEGGARIRFVPTDKADLETLREKLRERARKMNTTPCKH